MITKLSQREEQVMKMLVDGAKNRDIALELGIDQKTISTYINRIRVKLNIDSDVNVYVLVKTYLSKDQEKPFLSFADFQVEGFDD